MMNQRSYRNQRKHIRLRNYDYASCGLYFITFCTKDMQCMLSEIDIQGNVTLGSIGKIVEEEITSSEIKRSDLTIVDYVIMPNHAHLILMLQGENETGSRNQFGQPKAGSISAIIGHIKSRTTTRVRELHQDTSLQLWQDRFHDHVIRDEADLNRIREYVINNPRQRVEDRYHPNYRERLANKD